MRRFLFAVMLPVFWICCIVSAADGGGLIGEKLTPFRPVFLSGDEIVFSGEKGNAAGWVLAVFFQYPDEELYWMQETLSAAMGEHGDVIFLSGAPEYLLADYARLLPPEFSGMNIAADTSDRIAKRVLPGNVVLPFTILADSSGEMVWMGEPMEFSGVFPKIISGNYSPEMRKNAVAYYAELAGAIRSGNSANVRKTAEKILAAEPANPAAVQALMFFLEQSGNAAGAWLVLEKALQDDPDNLFLSMLALNFGARNNGLSGRVLGAVRQDLLLTAGEREKLSAVFMLLNGYAFDIAAIDMASLLLDSMSAEESDVLEFKALCAYRCGELDSAVRFQEAACSKAGNDPEGMQKRLQYYKTLTGRLNK